MRKLWEIARLFLKLGTISFGGPAAHIANMETEAVERRRWLSHEQFLDLFAATHLIPGPNAVEMANHIGYRRAGLIGSIVAGLCFSLPAVLITAAFAYSYVEYGDIPRVKPFLWGIKPVVLAIILCALGRLGRKSLRTWPLGLIGVGVVAAVFGSRAIFGKSDEVIILLVASLLGVILLRWLRSGAPPTRNKMAGVLAVATVAGAPGVAHASAAVVATGTAACAASASFSLWKLGLFFFKVGAVLYGGGYVLVAYLEGGLVDQYGWLNAEQLIDAVAIGQLTPGPMLSTATFVGYLVDGIPGAAVATLGILLPCFLFVAAVNPLIPKLRNSPTASLFLDAVTAASIGLMASVTVTLGRATLVDWPAWLIAAVATAVLLRWKVAPAWLVLAGAVAGSLLYAM